VPAVAKAGGNAGVNPDALIDYLRQVARLYPDAKVWNLSFNQVLPDEVLFTISYLGHELNAIAREFGLLLVISIGNRRADTQRISYALLLIVTRLSSLAAGSLITMESRPTRATSLWSGRVLRGC